MKVSLVLPWNKLRIMRRYTNEKQIAYLCRRWFKARGVIVPSERKQRRLSEEMIGNNLEDLRPAPLVYVPDLLAIIFQHLEQYER